MKDSSSAGTGAAATPCPNCGEPASGRFCSNCGTPLGGVACGVCQAELAPGAKFCHSCGTPVATPGVAASRAPAASPGTPDQAAGGKKSGNLPMAFVAVAFLAVVAIVAGQSMARSGSSGDAAAAGGAPLAGAAASGPMGQAPDISSMTPREQASKLYDLIMRMSEAGHTDSVQMFAPMATGAYEMLDSLSLDDRYDLGRIGVITGAYPLATAEADTILRKHPDHLLGLILAAEAANARKDTAAEKKYLDRLVKAAPAEQAKKLPEYQEHENDITAALAKARKG